MTTNTSRPLSPSSQVEALRKSSSSNFFDRSVLHTQLEESRLRQSLSEIGSPKNIRIPEKDDSFRYAPPAPLVVVKRKGSPPHPTPSRESGTLARCEVVFVAGANNSGMFVHIAPTEALSHDFERRCEEGDPSLTQRDERHPLTVSDITQLLGRASQMSVCKGAVHVEADQSSFSPNCTTPIIDLRALHTHRVAVCSHSSKPLGAGKPRTARQYLRMSPHASIQSAVLDTPWAHSVVLTPFGDLIACAHLPRPPQSGSSADSLVTWIAQQTFDASVTTKIGRAIEAMQGDKEALILRNLTTHHAVDDDIGLIEALRESNGGNPTPAPNLVLEEDIEGQALFSDGRRTLYIIGGMSARREVRKQNAGTTSMSSDSFQFYRRIRKVVLTPDGCFVESLRDLSSKSIVEPGVSYHTAVLVNPSTGARESASQVLVFGGFLDCVKKMQSSAFQMNRLEERQPHLSNARYGWKDCFIDEALYNTTADSTVMIPTVFNNVVDETKRCERADEKRKKWLSVGDKEHDIPPPLFCTNAVWSFDFKSTKWTHVVTVGSVPAGRAHHTAVVCGQYMFVAGGVGVGGQLLSNEVCALHTRQFIWTHIERRHGPSLSIGVLAVSTPHVVYFANSNNDDENGIEVQECTVDSLLAAANSRKKLELMTLRHNEQFSVTKGNLLTPGGDLHNHSKTPDPSHSLMVRSPVSSAHSTNLPSSLVLRTSQEIESILERLTKADEQSANDMAQLRAYHEEEAAKACGADCYLRTIKRPATVLEKLSERLEDRQRPQRRLQHALKFVAGYTTKKHAAHLTPDELGKKMSTGVAEMWQRNREVRLQNWATKQDQQRLPVSVQRRREADKSFVPSPVKVEEVVERLWVKDIAEARQDQYESYIERLHHETVAQSSARRRRSPSPLQWGAGKQRQSPLSPEEVAAQVAKLHENNHSMELKRKLFEQYVLQ